jgi:hypothetical protein
MEDAASKADVRRLEGKIDGLTTYLLEHPARR